MVHHRKNKCTRFFTFDLYFGVKVTQNVAQFYHVTYAPSKYEIAASNSLGGDALQENAVLTFDLESRPYEILPSTLYIM